MGSAVGDFTVTVTARETVTSPLPLHDQRLPLSNLDLVMPRGPLDVGVFFCYSAHNASTFADKANVLKRSLAEALVSFYVFAGEVVMNTAGVPEILCSNRGVEFRQASAMDVELRQLCLYNPDDCVEGKLLPKKENGVLCVQMTELKCGATIIGCTFDHRIADAYSANLFFVAWAHLATGAATTPPSFNRSLLTPRHPPSYDPYIDEIFVTYSSLQPPPLSAAATGPSMINRIYHLPATHISTLQSLATNKNPPSKLQTFSAYLWKLIAQHTYQLHQNDTVSTQNACKLGIVVDGRQQLGSTMSSYFGNVLSVPFADISVKELTRMPLADVAELVGKFLACAATKEHFLGLVDWVEAHRSEPIVAKVCTMGTETEPAFVVSSGQRFPVAEVDFGWGGPVFGSYLFPPGGSAGYVMPISSPKGNGDWIVYMHMFKAQLDFIEEKASHVFQPCTLDLLMTPKS